MNLKYLLVLPLIALLILASVQSASAQKKTDLKASLEAINTTALDQLSPADQDLL
jgi:hypothetical protein